MASAFSRRDTGVCSQTSPMFSLNETSFSLELFLSFHVRWPERKWEPDTLPSESVVELRKAADAWR